MNEQQATGTGPAPGEVVGRRWGAGRPTFVLVHGLGVAGRMVAPLGRALAAEGGTALAPDLPGFGARADEPKRSLGELRDWLAAWLDHQQEPVVLVGCSYGAQLALHVASVATPAGVVLASPTVDRHRRRVGRQLLRWPLEAATQPRSLRRIRWQDHRAASFQRVWATFREILDDRPEEVARQVTAPTLVLWGTRDPLVGRAWARELADGLPQGRFAELEARHAMTFTEPDACAAAIRSFLATVDVV